ncbi:MAG: hypothetical protein ACOX9E_04355 [Lentisphaeria bacterium]
MHYLFPYNGEKKEIYGVFAFAGGSVWMRPSTGSVWMRPSTGSVYAPRDNIDECKLIIGRRIQEKAERIMRIKNLKEAFEASGRKKNAANPDEVETLLTLTEKKIVQQCKRPHCRGCKLGWICPKFWSE